MSLTLNNHSSGPDQWVKTLSVDGGLKATAISAAGIVSEAGNRHGLKGKDLIILGEALIICLLYASRTKSGTRVSISLKGSGRYKQVMVDGTSNGEVRGYLLVRDGTEAQSLNQKSTHKLGPWGEGLISVVHLQPHEKEPYVGTCELVTGYLPKDFTVYLNQSEQIAAAVGAAVEVDKKGNVAAAGGFLVEVLPGASEETVGAIESNINAMDALVKIIKADSSPKMLLTRIFNDQPFSILQEHPVTFSCNCTRDRVSRALMLLGPEELKDMAAVDHGARINCDFCSEVYEFSADDLIKIHGAG